jgi:hypothetical protein
MSNQILEIMELFSFDKGKRYQKGEDAAFAVYEKLKSH